MKYTIIALVLVGLNSQAAKLEHNKKGEELAPPPPPDFICQIAPQLCKPKKPPRS